MTRVQSTGVSPAWWLLRLSTISFGAVHTTFGKYGRAGKWEVAVAVAVAVAVGVGCATRAGRPGRKTCRAPTKTPVDSTRTYHTL